MVYVYKYNEIQYNRGNILRANQDYELQLVLQHEEESRQLGSRGKITERKETIATYFISNFINCCKHEQHETEGIESSGSDNDIGGSQL